MIRNNIITLPDFISSGCELTAGSYIVVIAVNLNESQILLEFTVDVIVQAAVFRNNTIVNNQSTVISKFSNGMIRNKTVTVPDFISSGCELTAGSYIVVIAVNLNESQILLEFTVDVIVQAAVFRNNTIVNNQSTVISKFSNGMIRNNIITLPDFISSGCKLTGCSYIVVIAVNLNESQILLEFTVDVIVQVTILGNDTIT